MSNKELIDSLRVALKNTKFRPPVASGAKIEIDRRKIKKGSFPNYERVHNSRSGSRSEWQH